MLKVELVTYTPDPERVIASSVKVCHSKTIKEPETLTPEDTKRLIEMVRTSGHHSVMEHASFTFAISGVSRVLTHQLVRHRIASYSQQSQRYVDLGKSGFVTPPTVTGEADEIYKKHIDDAVNTYKELIEKGVPIEDARYVLPNAMSTNIIVSMNARALYNFLSLRTCRRAQDEIQQMAVAMLHLVEDICPTVFENAGPPCVRGPCPEGKYTCGKPMKRGEVTYP